MLCQFTCFTMCDKSGFEICNFNFEQNSICNFIHIVYFDICINFNKGWKVTLSLIIKLQLELLIFSNCNLRFLYLK